MNAGNKLFMGLGAAGSSDPDPLYGLWFDGVNDVVSFGDVYNFDYNTAYRIKFSFATTTAVPCAFLSKHNVSAGSFRGWFMALVAGQIRFDINNNGTNNISIRTNATYNDGLAHTVEARYTGSGLASGVTILVDGAAVATTTLSDSLGTGTTLSPGVPLRVGMRGADDTLIYSRVIRSVQILDGSGTVLSSWLGDSNVDSGWVDTVSTKHGTVSGSPARAVSIDNGVTWASE